VEPARRHRSEAEVQRCKRCVLFRSDDRYLGNDVVLDDRLGHDGRSVQAWNRARVRSDLQRVGILAARSGNACSLGLLFPAAVCTTPLAVFGIESATHFWVQGDPGAYTGFYDWIKGSWGPMELATVAVGFATIWYVRFPFLVAPISFASWFLSMDLAPFVFRTSSSELAWNDRMTISIVVGFVTIVAALFIDRVTREDYAIWLYFFGSMSFWGGVWGRAENADELTQFMTLVIALVFIAASPVLGRRVLAVYGCLGCFAYMGHLAWAFRDSLSFPVVLTVVGLGVIGLGLLFQRHLARIEAVTDALIPDAMRKLIPRTRIV